MRKASFKMKIFSLVTAFSMIISLGIGFSDYIAGEQRQASNEYAAAETIAEENDNISSAVPFQNYVVKASEPPNHYTMHLFDYWGTDSETAPVIGENGYWGEGVPWGGSQYYYDDDYLWRKLQMNSADGINAGHNLKFYLTPAQQKDDNNPPIYTDFAGTWNRSTETNKWITGIVNNTLNGAGYPYLNLNSDSVSAYSDGGDRNESLDYLFAPENGNGKAAYTDVTGLFQLDKDGYYYYDSSKNYAWLNGDEFVLYDIPGVAAGGSSVDGQFFPFNNPETSYTLDIPFDGKNRADLIDYYNHDGAYDWWNKMYDPSGIIRAGVGDETATIKVYKDQAPDNEQNTIYFPSVAYWDDNVGNFGWTLHDGEFNGVQKAFEGKNFYVSFTVVDINGYAGNDIEFYGRLVGGDQDGTIKGNYSGNKVIIDLGVLSDKYSVSAKNAGMTWYASLPDGKYADDITVTYKDFQLYYTESNGTIVNVDDNLPNPGDKLRITYPAIFNEKNGTLEMAAPAVKGEAVSYRNYTLASTSAVMNHWFGMSFEIDFQQPANGKINRGNESKDMTFEFAGDDDIWIFIDDVLVMDLGGVHSSLYGIINFATGDIMTSIRGADGLSEDHKYITNLYEKFVDASKANAASWRSESSGDIKTFADGSEHTIKVFYLERGGWDSNLAIKYNIEPTYPHQIYKIDAQGNPMNGVSFDLYKAQKNGDEYTKAGAAIASITTDENGLASFADSNGKYINFGELGTKYYILQESTPAGYKPAPDIILEYNANGDYFIVVNKWESGAYASFTDYRSQAANNVHYAKYDPDKGTITGDNVKINDLKEGLTIAVPVILNLTDTDNSAMWLPLTGSNLSGWKTIDVFKPGVDTAPNTQQPQREALRKNLVIAALRQISDDDAPLYTMAINETTGLLSVDIHDLPGNPNQYLTYGDTGDGKDGKVFSIMMVRIEPEALNAFGEVIYGTGNGSRVHDFDTLKQALQSWADGDLDGFKERFDYAYENGESKWNVLKSLINAGYDTKTTGGASNVEYYERGYNMVYLGDFKSAYRSVIYIPNDKRELIVSKVNTEGEPLSDTEFTLYKTWQDAAEQGEKFIVSAETNEDGILVFNRDKDGKEYTFVFGKDSAGKQCTWADVSKNGIYWLRETKAPDGYEANPYLIEVVVNDSAVYVNASAYKVSADGKTIEKVDKTANENTDNVKVYASVGRLVQNMAKYAYGGGVDTTLMDIDAALQTYIPDNVLKSENALVWTPAGNSYENLHYYGNGDDVYTDYTKHTADFVTGEAAKNYGFFEVLNGYADVKPTQPVSIKEPSKNKAASHEILGDTDLHGLFVTVNIVEVTDKAIPEEVEPQKTILSHEEGATVKSGEKIEYKISWENATTKPATITITDPLDENVEFVSAKFGDVELKYNDKGELTGGAGKNVNITLDKADGKPDTVKWVIENVPAAGDPDSKVEVFLTVKVKPTKQDYIVNQAYTENSNITEVDGTSGETVAKKYETEEIENPVDYTYSNVDLPPISIAKKLTGRDWLSGDSFSFELTDLKLDGTEIAAADYIAVKGSMSVTASSTAYKDDKSVKLSDGNVITFKEAGKYTFTIKEVDGGKTTNGVKYDEKKYGFEVNVRDNNEGALVIDKILVNNDDRKGAESITLEFENKYSAAPVSADIPVKKIIDGRNWLGNEAFDFEIELDSYSDGTDASGVTMPSPNSITINEPDTAGSSNSGKFELTFTKAGVYTFTVKETAPDGYDDDTGLNGLFYDLGEHTVEVTVADNGKGALTANITSIDGKSVTDSDDKNVTVTNDYRPDSTKWSPEVSKDIDGRAPIAGDEFSFTITAADNYGKNAEIKGDKAVIKWDETAKEWTVANKFVVFFNKAGDYIFQIKEDVPKDAEKGVCKGITYDTTVYTITVNVKEDTVNGGFTVETAAQKDNEEYEEDVYSFVNTYAAAPGSVTLGVNKEIDGRALAADDSFSFTLEPASDYGTSVKYEYTTATVNGANGSEASFGKITFFKDGQYKFKISEDVPDGDLKGITYADPQEITVNVTEDKANGKLNAVITTLDGESIEQTTALELKFVNKYTAPETSESDTSRPTAPDKPYPSVTAASTTTTEPAPSETTTTTAESPSTETMPPIVTTPPVSGDDNFNLDDDGLPRGDENLPTGVVLGGSVAAISALFAAAASYAAGKRKRSRKGK